ncbi:mitochondrial import inner membrane translocase subunit tim21 [Fusarium solani]
MKPTTFLIPIRSTVFVGCPSKLQPLLLSRCYATHKGVGATPQGPKRRAVTPFNDTGYVPWSQLSVAEKAGRATQQTVNFGMILIGLVLTGGVTYFMWTEVFSPDSKISNFNRAVDRIKDDPRCLELLGDAKKISAHGDETFNKWRRARPVAYVHGVEGPLNNGVARLHMIRHRGQGDYEYKYFFVDVKGHERVYLEHEETAASKIGKKLSFFGVKWG